MELKNLRNFLFLAEELHFRRAAERLHISQPPLSRQIQDLERELGAALFVRGRRREVRLTPAGEALRDQATDLLDRLDRGVEAVRQIGRGIRGKLTIGMASAMAYGPVPGWLKAFRDRFTDVDIDLRELPTSAQENALRCGDLDLGFTYPPLVSGGLRSRTVATETIVVALPAGHPFPRRGPFPPALLVNQPIVCFPRSASPGLYDLLHGRLPAGSTPRIVQHATELQTVIGFVAAGMGVALVPSTLVNLRRPGVVYRPLAGDLPVISTLAVWRSDRRHASRDLLLDSLPTLL